MFKKHMINLVRLIKRYLPDSLVAFAGGIGLLPSRRHSSICSPEFDQAINECIVWLSALLHPFEFSLIVKCEEGISFLIIEKNPFDGTGIFVSKHCYWGVQPCCCLSIKEERVFSILFFSYFCDPCSQKCICWLGLKLNCFDERVRHRLLRLHINYTWWCWRLIDQIGFTKTQDKILIQFQTATICLLQWLLRHHCQ